MLGKHPTTDTTELHPQPLLSLKSASLIGASAKCWAL
jgi:hypothetical protein